MEAAIELDQLAEMRLAVPALPMRRPLPRPAPQARRQHPATQRVVMHRHAIFTGQMLRRQRRPKPRVPRPAVLLPHQRQNALALRDWTRMIGDPPGAAVL
jgi:hypothetical protein